MTFLTSARGRLVAWVLLTAGLVVLPLIIDEFWVGRVTGWIPLAVAACGLNLLTGYNGQISVGHGALYGVGAYGCALVVERWDWPFLAGVVAAAVLSFVVGLIVGLPALRIKGLYLALVTLALATLFPDLLNQFKDLTGGANGLKMTDEVLNPRGRYVDVAKQFKAPSWSGLSDAEWRYYLFLVLAFLCFVVVWNLVNSRSGRSMIAIRDNEVAAEVNGIPVARTKVVTFGLSSALAGIGGALYALTQMQLFSAYFTITLSLYFLVAVVIGGTATVIGPAVGAVVYGVFNDVITPDLPERWKPATPLILGVALIGLMLVAPEGIVGYVKRLAVRAVGAVPPPESKAQPTTGEQP